MSTTELETKLWGQVEERDLRIAALEKRIQELESPNTRMVLPANDPLVAPDLRIEFGGGASDDVLLVLSNESGRIELTYLEVRDVLGEFLRHPKWVGEAIEARNRLQMNARLAEAESIMLRAFEQIRDVRDGGGG